MNTGTKLGHSVGRLKRALLKYKDLIVNEEASTRVRAAQATKTEVLWLLRDQGFHERCYEYMIVKDNYLQTQFPTGYLVNSFQAHLSSYQPLEIIEAYKHIAPVVPPSDTMMTSEQINISNKFLTIHRDRNKETPVSTDQYEELVQYAMIHTEDWHLIEPLIFDRGTFALPQLVNVLAVVKETGHTALSEGSL